MDLERVLIPALVAAVVATHASAALGEAPAPAAPKATLPPASKAPDAVLLELCRTHVRGPILATTRAAFPSGAAVLAIAYGAPKKRGGGVAFELFVLATNPTAGYFIVSHEEARLGPSVGSPLLTLAIGALPIASGAFTATVGWKADDGSTEEQQVVFRYRDRQVNRLLVAPPGRTYPVASGRPAVRQELSLLPTAYGGLRDVLLQTRTATCETAGDCTETVERTSYRFDGVHYVARPYAIPFLETIAASSELPSRGGLVDNSAAAAVDGRLDTAWCEGAPGPGWFQKLELSFVPAQLVKAVSIVPGLGTGDAYREVTRPKRVRVLLPDGRKVEADLVDEPRPQRIAIPEGERVFGMTVVIVDVYKGKREDACISELGLEVEP